MTRHGFFHSSILACAIAQFAPLAAAQTVPRAPAAAPAATSPVPATPPAAAPAPQLPPAPAPAPVSAPPQQTAPPVTTAAAETVVVARDGAVFRGELVERVPGQYVTVRLSTGEHRRVRWDFIASIGSGTAGAPIVPARTRVYFSADDEGAVLEKRGADGEWFAVCRTPCAGEVSPAGLYRVTGSGLTTSEPFRLSRSAPATRVDVEVGTKGRAVLGAVLAIGGGAAAYVGLIVFSTAGLVEGGSDPDEELSDSEQSRRTTTGAVMMVGGGAAAIAGLVLLLNNRTTVDLKAVSSQATARARRRVASTDLFAIPLTKDIQLTPRGLVF